MAIWGIDLGGTKIEIAVLDRHDPESVLTRQRIPTEGNKGYDHILNQVKRVIDLASDALGFRPHSIGIGTPGAHDPQTQTHKNSNTTAINGRPFKLDLERLLGIPVHMANDANCFALAEARMGAVPRAMPSAQMVFGVIMGTGVGGGLVINGKVWNGRQGIGGEWGHSFLDFSGGPCYCGQTGCVETLISGPALERYYESLSGEKRKLKDIMAMVDDDPHAEATVERLLHFFGKGMANLINILDPDVIVLGGGVGTIPQLYSLGIERVKQFVFNPRLDTIFLKPRLGDSAGVFGAAMLTD